MGGEDEEEEEAGVGVEEVADEEVEREAGTELVDEEAEEEELEGRENLVGVVFVVQEVEPARVLGVSGAKVGRELEEDQEEEQ